MFHLYGEKRKKENPRRGCTLWHACIQLTRTPSLATFCKPPATCHGGLTYTWILTLSSQASSLSIQAEPSGGNLLKADTREIVLKPGENSDTLFLLRLCLFLGWPGKVPQATEWGAPPSAEWPIVELTGGKGGRRDSDGVREFGRGQDGPYLTEGIRQGF